MKHACLGRTKTGSNNFAVLLIVLLRRGVQRGAACLESHQGVVKYLTLLFTPSSFPLASIESTV
jgi:hypothetical protein